MVIRMNRPERLNALTFEVYGELRDHYRNSLLGLVKKQGLARSKIHVLEALLRLGQLRRGQADPFECDRNLLLC